MVDGACNRWGLSGFASPKMAYGSNKQKCYTMKIQLFPTLLEDSCYFIFILQACWLQRRATTRSRPFTTPKQTGRTRRSRSFPRQNRASCCPPLLRTETSRKPKPYDRYNQEGAGHKHQEVPKYALGERRRAQQLRNDQGGLLRGQELRGGR